MGEVLQGSDLLFENPFEPDRGNRAECNPDGTSTMRFTETGVATGPYPGTFEEEVTLTIGPQSSQGLPYPALSRGRFSVSMRNSPSIQGRRPSAERRASSPRFRAASSTTGAAALRWCSRRVKVLHIRAFWI